MWTTLSVRISLLTLAVVMFFSASDVDSQIHFRCCDKLKASKPIDKIKQCYEQKKRTDCNYHAFVIETEDGKIHCVKPTPPWLKNRIKAKELECPPEFSKTLRRFFLVLDEDDLE